MVDKLFTLMVVTFLICLTVFGIFAVKYNNESYYDCRAVVELVDQHADKCDKTSNWARTQCYDEAKELYCLKVITD